MIIEILDRARQDVLEGCRFYETQREGVGRYFFDSLMGDIESLHLYAGVHAKQWGYYRMIARRFRMRSTIVSKKRSFKFMRCSIAGVIPRGFGGV